MASYYPIKFSVPRHSRKGDMMFLVCHLISKDSLIKGSCGFMDDSPYSKSLPAQTWWP